MSTTRPHAADDRGSDPGDIVVPEAGSARVLRLLGESAIVPRARDFTREALQAWGWLPASSPERRAAAEDVLLVVSELVTNACLHADGPDELRLIHSPKVLRLEVADSGAGEPVPRVPHRAGRPGGHGMFIVQRLCTDWGVARHAGQPGKTVWAELAAPA
ncbi:ATP-binding protein [Streptomyces sp. SID13666]|uniref:ATP-binding protein n=1 Tax=Streptomyces TaxID=1883 RepID=UPI0011072E96|nr:MULTISPECIES: ATP-binding protein [Streptomyces]MCZ4100143.1 ATP-binding protein [Streptomyces sp. H39-C1]NEA54308.1 ATP-binding protein [Streptomyces sp. SID13666]NEA75066.1 ATP-binding protein [Streptomyces sp. SID13588]QNA73730.1 ATP-binding protein [Streptomyces sp. So13.3]